MDDSSCRHSSHSGEFGSPQKEVKFSGDEESLVIRMYNLVGERWHLIAGRIPGRTARDVEKYWNSKRNASEEDTPPQANKT